MGDFVSSFLSMCFVEHSRK